MIIRYSFITIMIIGTIVFISSCDKDPQPIDPNEFVYGEWDYESQFESIWIDNLDTNYTVDEYAITNFCKDSQVEFYIERRPEGMEIDSYNFQFSMHKDTFGLNKFYQSGEYLSFTNDHYFEREIDSLSLDYFSTVRTWEYYHEDVDRTSINYTCEKFRRR